MAKLSSDESQQNPLLTTKLYIPALLSRLVSRSRLIEQMDAGASRKLTLVSGPAGFGKTTLVAEWAHRAQRPVAWLSLDENDNDLSRFLNYLVAALQGIDKSVGVDVRSALRAPQTPRVEPLLTVLINDISAVEGPFTLILDDSHTISSAAIHNALAFLANHQPPQMHLVVVGRVDLPLPLARLRAQGQLTEIRTPELRFTQAEVASFLNDLMGFDLSPTDIAALGARTEGWVASLQLAALSLQGRQDRDEFIAAFSGSHRYIIDYLMDEVMSRQPEGIRSFLRQTSILDRLCAALCDATLDVKAPTSRQILNGLEAANLFLVSLDNERHWYRYHQLFRDFLGQRLHEQEPSRVTELHNRASGWYEHAGFVDEAIKHAAAAEDFGRVANMIAGRADAFWAQGKHNRLLEWLETLPDEELYSRPQLGVFHAWCLFANGQHSAAEQSLLAAERALASTGDRVFVGSPKDRRAHLSKANLRGRLATIRAFMASFRGDVPAIIKSAQEAHEMLAEQDAAWRCAAALSLGDAHSLKGDMIATNRALTDALKASKAAGSVYLELIARAKLTHSQWLQGGLQHAVDNCHEALRLASEGGFPQTAMEGLLCAVLAEILCELDDLDSAIHYAKTGVNLTELGSAVGMRVEGYLSLGRVLFVIGDLASAAETFAKLERLIQESDLRPWTQSLMEAWKARVWLAQGRLDAASQWVTERRLSVDNELSYLCETEHITLARILVAQDRIDEAIKLLDRLLEAAEKGGRIARMIDILVIQASSLQAQGDTAHATAILERALSLAKPGGFIRVFINEGGPMAELLRHAASRGITPAYVNRLLTAFTFETQRPSAAGTQPQGTKDKMRSSAVQLLPLAEPLSERELEVLRLMAAGLKYKEISDQLFISLNTVRFHVKNIFGKLAVHNRAQATDTAKALALLKS